MAARPNFIVCYLCGREYGKSSLEIHQKKCAELWLARESQKPARERKPLPSPPELSSSVAAGSKRGTEQYNDAAREYYNEQVLIACPFCARTFLENPLKVHLRSCGRGKSLPAELMHLADDKMVAKGPSPMEAAKAKGPIHKPRFVMCYLCGKEFGRQSLDIHQKRCEELFLQREALKPPAERRPIPPPPELAMEDPGYNDAAFEAYNARALVPCELCGRTFLEDSLKVHLRSCKGERPVRRATGAEDDGHVRSSSPPAASMSRSAGAAAAAGSSRGGSSAAVSPMSRSAGAAAASSPKGSLSTESAKAKGPRFVMCYLCGKEFGRQSLDIHQKRCEELFVQREALKPPAERRPVPPPPELAMEDPGYNDAAFEAYNARALVPCELCGRTFLEDSLKVHLRSCKGERPVRRATGAEDDGRVRSSSPPAASMSRSAGAAAAAGSSRGGSLSPRRSAGAGSRFATMPSKGSAGVQQNCYICDRTYASDALPGHVEKCKTLWQQRTSLPLPDPPQ